MRSGFSSLSLIVAPTDGSLRRGWDGNSFGRPGTHQHRLKWKDLGAKYAARDRGISRRKQSCGVERRSTDDSKGEGGWITVKGSPSEDQNSFREQLLRIGPVLSGERLLERSRAIGEHCLAERSQCVEEQTCRNLSRIGDVHV